MATVVSNFSLSLLLRNGLSILSGQAGEEEGGPYRHHDREALAERLKSLASIIVYCHPLPYLLTVTVNLICEDIDAVYNGDTDLWYDYDNPLFAPENENVFDLLEEFLTSLENGPSRPALNYANTALTTVLLVDESLVLNPSSLMLITKLEQKIDRLSKFMTQKGL